MESISDLPESLRNITFMLGDLGQYRCGMDAFISRTNNEQLSDGLGTTNKGLGDI